MSIPIEDGDQHREDELPEGNSLKLGLAILSRMIARRLLSGRRSDSPDQVEEGTEPGDVVKVARHSPGIGKKNVRNRA